MSKPFAGSAPARMTERFATRPVRRAAIAAAAFVAACFAMPAAHAQTVLTMSSWVPPSHGLTAVFLPGWAAEVERATQGRVKLRMLPKHPAAAPGTFDAVRDGLVDVSFVTASYTPSRHILPLLAELPGSGATSEINSVAFSRIHWKYLQAANEYKGVKLLGVWTHGAGQMFTKKPVNTIRDLQGMKIRTGGGIAEEVARALGAAPFVKPAPESYELLSTGVADGTFFPFESVASFKLETVITQATAFPGGMYSSAFGFFMNEDRWNKLSKQDQDAIASVSFENVAHLAGRSWDAADRNGYEVLKKANVKIVEPDAALMKEVRTRSQPIIDNWIERATKERGLDGRKVYNEFHEELVRVADELKRASGGK